jgi:uncharacterized protein YrrD
MTTEQAETQVIKRHDLINRRVFGKNVEEVGKVDQCWVDPQSHQVIGFTCKSGFLGKNKRWFAWSQVDTVGENILLNINAEESTTQQPEKAMVMIGSEILTDGGNPVGALVDYFLDVKTGGVVNYLFKSSGWRGVLDGIYLLAPTGISSVGSKNLIVASEAIADPQQYMEGINQKVGQAKDVLTKDLSNTMKHVEGVKGVAQNLAEKLQEQAQIVKEKAQAVKETAQEQAQIVKEKAQAVKEAAQEQAHAVMEKAQAVKEVAQEQAQIVKEKAQAVKETAQEQAHAVMEKAQAVKETAQEQAQAVKEVAQEQAQAMMEKAQAVKEIAQEKTQVVMENAQAVKEVAQEQAQAVKEMAQEKTQAVLENAQAVKEMAQEKIDEVRNRREEASEAAATAAIKEDIKDLSAS